MSDMEPDVEPGPEAEGPSFLMRVTNDEADTIFLKHRKDLDDKVATWRLERLMARLGNFYADPEHKIREWSRLDPGRRRRWRERYALSRTGGGSS